MPKQGLRSGGDICPGNDGHSLRGGGGGAALWYLVRGGQQCC